MLQRKLVLIVFVLLLIFVGLATAQSSTNYIVQRFVVSGGSSAESANYTLTSVVGQPATGVVASPNYRASAGFLYPLHYASGANNKAWLPVILR